MWGKNLSFSIVIPHLCGIISNTFSQKNSVLDNQRDNTVSKELEIKYETRHIRKQRKCLTVHHFHSSCNLSNYAKINIHIIEKFGVRYIFLEEINILIQQRYMK